MKTLLRALWAAILLTAAPAFAQNSNLNEQDKTFIKSTLDANLAQVKLGDLAQKQAHSPVVKAVAHWLSADDHFVNEHLQKLARGLGETQSPALTQQAQALQKELEGVKGAQFDQKYLEGIKQAMEKAVVRFTSEEKSIQNPQLKSFAQHITPILEAHLNMANALSYDLSRASEQNQPSATTGSAPRSQGPNPDGRNGGMPPLEQRPPR